MSHQQDFWLSRNSSRYEDFSTSIPSDIPAYEVVYHLLCPKEKVILDFEVAKLF